MIHCIQKLNPGAGFLNSHRSTCTYCPDPATAHVYVSGFCGNVCDEHRKRAEARNKGCEVSRDIYIDQGAMSHA